MRTIAIQVRNYNIVFGCSSFGLDVLCVLDTRTSENVGNNLLDVEVENLPIAGSDHGPICVSWNHRRPKMHRLLKWRFWKHYNPLALSRHLVQMGFMQLSFKNDGDFNRKKGRTGVMAIKLDLEKAYLGKFGFSSTWINWIIECITSVSFSIVINGKAEGFFQPTRGIRQGDPLSPYIFILCMEPLIRHLNPLADKPSSQVGILSSPCGYRIANLMFADDCLIFCKTSSRAARNVLSVLNNFSEASGKKINFHKPSLYFSPKVPNHQVRNDIVTVMQIQHKATIGKYLGVHNIIFWKDHVNANDLLQRINKKLAGWKKGTLSRAGRLILLQANVSYMPDHIMSCFKCPAKITNEIDKKARDFFWGTDSKAATVAWSKIWQKRNDCVFKNKNFSPMQLLPALLHTIATLLSTAMFLQV
ncbi:hypothetical protein ACLB2K_029928 [Fragaria x ananassa]